MGCSGSKNTTGTLVEQGKLLFIDQSDNGYVLRGRRSMIKYDFRNHPTDRYDFDLTIHQAGLSTDLRIYAYNPDFQKFYILDKYLNEITQFSFNEYFDFWVSHPVLANGQTIWLHNQTENKIQQYSTQLKFLDESRNLDWEVPGVHVDQLFYHQNELYLVDHSLGIFVFDYAGRLRKRIPVPAPTRDVQIDRTMSRIYTYFSQQWHVMDPDEIIPRYTPLEIPDKIGGNGNNGLIFENGKIYFWDSTLQKIGVRKNNLILLPGKDR